MRRPFIAGNWKMNLNRESSVSLASEVLEKLKQMANRQQVEVAVCPPSCYLEAVATAVDPAILGVGAQNMYHETEGAFTGEVSPQISASSTRRVRSIPLTILPHWSDPPIRSRQP